VKNKHIVDCYSTSGTLDLTNETAELEKAEYIYKENPNRESWDFETAGEFRTTNGWNNEIIYNICSDYIDVHDLSKIERSVLKLGNGDVENGRLSLVYSSVSGGLRRVDDTTVGAVTSVPNGDLYQHNLLDTFFQDFRYFEKAIVNGVQETSLGLRPLLQLPEINFYYNGLLNAFDMGRSFTTSMGGTFAMEFNFKLKDKKAGLVVHK